jgi:catechol 2,3-dioxygenase-like lactoylglutathione lyase family enzyme
MKLIDDIHHLAFVTHDMDRLIAFYDRVFSARVTADLMEDGLRHCFIEIGSHTVLHPFQIPGVEPETSQPMFRRGRLDHFALNATSEAAFHELRRRLVAEGASNGVITDMGSLLNSPTLRLEAHSESWPYDPPLWGAGKEVPPSS